MRKSNKFIPVNAPIFSGNEKKYLNECIDTGWISSEGPYVKKFEDAFAEYIECDHGIAVANGSAALDVALKALNLSANDEVIMPTFTIISPAFSVIKTGATPILIDCDPLTWNMDVNSIEKKITKKTRAILVVHIYGLPVEMDPILKLCKKYKLLLIEDAAEVHGQTYKGKKCGSFGDISIFSFYPNKHITTGEGGMILVNDKSIADRCRNLKNLSFEPDKPRFVHYDFGWNYRMTNMQAALGLAQLENINKHIIKKREIGNEYVRILKNIDSIFVNIPKTDYAENIYWVNSVVIKNEKIKATEVMKKLSSRGIGTRPFFFPMHLQPVFIKMGLFVGESYPVSENIASQGFYLPSGLGLEINDIRYITDNLKEVLNEYE